MGKISIAFDMDGVILDSVPTIVQLHHELTGEIPKIHHSQSTSWDFQDIITADRDTINSYFEHPRFFEIVPFISDDILSMKALINGLLSDDDICVSICTKGTLRNFIAKQDWLNERLPRFNIDNMSLVKFNVEGKPHVNSTIFIDDVSANMNGQSKYKILFRKNGLITEYNNYIPDGVLVANSVCELASIIYEIIEFERVR